MDDDLYGNDAKDASKRISAWASNWGVRQFQQLGGPPVTLYRELRRIQGNEAQGFSVRGLASGQLLLNWTVHIS